MNRTSHTEWIDQRGITSARDDIHAQLAGGHLDLKNTRSAHFLLKYLDAVDEAYGATQHGTSLRPQDVTYVRRFGYGRAYAKAPKGPLWSDTQPSAVCVQGMSAALRPYLLSTVCHDIDIENCHPAIVEQLAKWWHVWPEHGGIAKPLETTKLHSLVTERAAFFHEITQFHGLPRGGDQAEHSKKMCKRLVLRLMYGGSYAAWLRENKLPRGAMAPCVVALQLELSAIRDALLNSMRFEKFVHAERERLAQMGKIGEKANRSIFSKISQHLEHIVLMAMRRYLITNGWDVHSLVYDGLTVAHQQGRKLDLKEMEWHVERETQFTLKITEKPLFGVKASIDLSSVDV